MKEYLRKHKELIRWTSMIPLAAIIPIFPINLFLLIVQISCLSLMFWIGWDFE
jgi:hypothetical protein